MKFDPTSRGDLLELEMMRYWQKIEEDSYIARISMSRYTRAGRNDVKSAAAQEMGGQIASLWPQHSNAIHILEVYACCKGDGVLCKEIEFRPIRTYTRTVQVTNRGDYFIDMKRMV